MCNSNWLEVGKIGYDRNSMLNLVDRLLNSMTMYRVVLYGLVLISLTGIIFGFLNLLPYSGWELLVSCLVLITSCYVVNMLFVLLFKAIPNNESFLISALILFLILLPGYTQGSLISFILAAIISMASKYLLAINKKHLFNPVASAMVVLPAMGLAGAGWWVGHPNLLPIVAIVGLLVIRRLRRFSLVLAFIVTSFLTYFLVASKLLGLGTYQNNLFFMTIMLTEPLTSPSSKKLQIIFGGAIGILFSLPFILGPFYSSPELSLVVGNILNFLTGSKQKVLLVLKNKVKQAQGIWEFSFLPDKKLNFKPGQYLEWTIKNKHFDSRGNRRFFTLASSPTEEDIKLGVRFPQNGSGFKRSLLELKTGETMVASGLAGEFVMPDDPNKKLAFIAGGIGITPFRSMLKYLVDTKKYRDIVLFYVCKSSEEFVYKDVIDKAKDYGVKTIYHETEKKGFITSRVIKKEMADYLLRRYYISGPPGMVDSYRKLARELGVKSQDIVTDLFIGY